MKYGVTFAKLVQLYPSVFVAERYGT